MFLEDPYEAGSSGLSIEVSHTCFGRDPGRHVKGTHTTLKPQRQRYSLRILARLKEPEPATRDEHVQRLRST